MKTRVSAQDVPPGELLLFDGRGLTYEEWNAAFDAWCTAREAWEAAHEDLGLVLPDGDELGECPPDPEFLMLMKHGGGWSRPPYSDGPMVCAEHGLTLDEHLRKD